MSAAAIFLCGMAFALAMVGCCIAVEMLARRGERIERARHRDHANVPRWPEQPGASA